MKLPTLLKNFSAIETVLTILFILFIIFPIEMPDSVANMVDSPLGMVVLFGITLSLFVYFNPILGVLYILVAYELLRRSSNVTARTAIIEYTPTQKNKNRELKRMNPTPSQTLEEEIVEARAPIGKSDQGVYIDTTFKPVADKTDGASLYNTN
jgi:Rad3-related DNA helicase